jgi:hypothetical protein
VRYGLIESLRRSYPVALMCRVLDVSESGFHARRARPPCNRERENARLEIETYTRDLQCNALTS